MDTEAKKRLPKITFNAPVVLCFVAICVAVQLVSTITFGMSTKALFTFNVTSLANPLEWFKLVTFAFGHVSWDHLVGNMGYILLLGPLLEEKYGSKRLAVIILVSALACSITSILIFRAGGVGASGVVFTFILLSSVTSVREGEVPLTFVLVAVLYLGQQVYGALFVHDHVSYHGHIVGGIVGAVVGFLIPERTSPGIGGH